MYAYFLCISLPHFFPFFLNFFFLPITLSSGIPKMLIYLSYHNNGIHNAVSMYVVLIHHTQASKLTLLAGWAEFYITYRVPVYTCGYFFSCPL